MVAKRHFFCYDNKNVFYLRKGKCRWNRAHIVVYVCTYKHLYLQNLCMYKICEMYNIYYGKMGKYITRPVEDIYLFLISQALKGTRVYYSFFF